MPVPYYHDEEAGITLFCGLAEDVVPTLPVADLWIVDPPYLLTASGGGIGAQRDYLGDIDGHLDAGFGFEILAGVPNFFCFCGKEQLPEMFRRFCERRWMLLTWNKSNPTPLTNNNYLPDTEYIFHCFQSGRLFGDYRDKSRFILHPVEKNGFDHPTVKPLAVVSKLVRLGSKVGDLIVDCYAGMGTTLLAAKLEGRRAIGVEVREDYCEAAANRLRQATLFGTPARVPMSTPSLFAENK